MPRKVDDFFINRIERSAHLSPEVRKKLSGEIGNFITGHLQLVVGLGMVTGRLAYREGDWLMPGVWLLIGIVGTSLHYRRSFFDWQYVLGLIVFAAIHVPLFAYRWPQTWQFFAAVALLVLVSYACFILLSYRHIFRQATERGSEPQALSRVAPK